MRSALSCSNGATRCCWRCTAFVPRGIWVVVLLAALVVFCVDLVGTLLAMAGLRYRWPAAAAVETVWQI